MPVINCETGEVRDHTPEELAAIAAANQPKPVTAIERWKAKKVLNDVGLLGDFEADVNDPATPAIVRVMFYEYPEWLRDDPHLNAMAQARGLTSEQIDDLFQAAAAT